MSKLVINSFEDFEKYVGQPLGESEHLAGRPGTYQPLCRCHFGPSMDSHGRRTCPKGKPVQEHHRTRLSDPLPPALSVEPDHRGQQPEDDD